jgi:hypothetical protein
VDPVGDRHPRRLQVHEGGCDYPLSQVVPRVVVESDDQDARVVAADGHDKVVQIGEVFVVSAGTTRHFTGTHFSITLVSNRHDAAPGPPSGETEAQLTEWEIHAC